MSGEIFYFGTWPGDRGHYLWGKPRQVWRTVYGAERLDCPWSDGELDGYLLNPEPNVFPKPAWIEKQVEFYGRLFVKEGWTCFSFWNRQFDPRFNSNSAFLQRKETSFHELLREAEVALPEIFSKLQGRTLFQIGENGLDRAFLCGEKL